MFVIAACYQVHAVQTPIMMESSAEETFSAVMFHDL